MKQIQIIVLILTILKISVALDCTISLPRLLIGRKYSNMASSETARILFDTKDDCSDVATLILAQGNSFKFTSFKPLLQKVDDTLDHNGKSVEKVSYSKYTMVFSIEADVQKSYQVGFQGNKNDENTKYPNTYTFTLPKLGAQYGSQKNEGIKFMFYGDQDLTENGRVTFDYLLQNKDKNKFDSFFFLGDYAYEFYQDNGVKGDQFIEQLSPISFNYPLVMAPGNHEDNLNFTLFNSKFLMPDFDANTNLNNYNSFNMGNVHFIHLNLHFYSITKPQEQLKMIEWLKKDLSNVERDITPWIIAFGHKLIYCYDSLYDNSECIGYAKQFDAIAAILNHFGVDLFVAAHQHNNQVMAPMAGHQIQEFKFNPITNQIYKNQGFVTIVQGNGGCYNTLDQSRLRRFLTDFPDNLKEASLFQTKSTIGFGYIEVFNQTYLEYTSYDAKNDKVVTKFGVTSFHQKYESSTLLLVYKVLTFILLFIAF